MTNKQPIRLGKVQETMLIPLYGRAQQTKAGRGRFDDQKAVEMVDAIDYDFTRFDNDLSLSGAVLRTSIIDVWVREFLDHNPEGTVVEIGAGLNTRFERVDNGRLHWIDLDLPDVMELRRRFFTDSDRRQMLATSVLDPTWIERVRRLPGPYFFAAEASIIYLPETDVKKTVGMIAEHFPASLLAVDTATRLIIDSQDTHPSLKKVSARMRWACDDPAGLSNWEYGMRLRDSRTIAQAPASVRGNLPLRLRVLLAMAQALRVKRVVGYRINLFEVLGGR